jgi:hypothetical protein
MLGIDLTTIGYLLIIGVFNCFQSEAAGVELRSKTGTMLGGPD